MLIPREFACANGDLADMAGLPARNGGSGLLLCEDVRGLRYTVAGDAGYLRLLLNIPPDAVPGTIGDKNLRDLFGGEGAELPPETFPPPNWLRQR